MRRAMQSGQKPFDHLTGHELEPTQGSELAWFEQIRAAGKVMNGGRLSHNIRS